jgi:hypothetical protein
MKIGVKFCGHCNPQADMPALLETLAKAEPCLDFGRWELPGYEVLLVLNACSAGCATKPTFDGTVLWVTPASVNDCPIEKGELCTTILQKLRTLKEGTGATKTEKYGKSGD